MTPATYESESEANIIDIQNKTYTYNEDGTIKQAADNVESKYGQLYEYDFASRLKKNQFGTGSASPTPQYKQILGYDAFSNLTGRQTWDKDNNERTFTAGYTNNRKTTGGYGIGTDTHDNAGNIVENIVSYTPSDKRTWKFDAAGKMTDWEETSTYYGTTRWDQGKKLTFDGDGRIAKRENRRRIWASPPFGWYNEPEYTIFSSVTGQAINQLDQDGAKRKTNVYMGSSVIAEQDCLGTCDFTFSNIDPITGSSMKTEADGDFPPSDSGRTEVEPLGAMIPTQEPETTAPYGYDEGHILNPEHGPCVIDGILQPNKELCTLMLANGAGIIGRHDAYVIIRGKDNKDTIVPARPTSDGWVYYSQTERVCVTVEGGKPDCTESLRTVPNSKESLSDCIVNILKGEFRDFEVDGRLVEIVADARFIKGLPWWSKVPGKVGVGVIPGGMTLGLYNIHYDPSIDLQSPTWNDLRTIVEELVHGEQFIEMWQKMPTVPEKTEMRHGVGREPMGPYITPAHRPDYEEAQTQWHLNYAGAVIQAVIDGRETYDNHYERDAKDRMFRIMGRLRVKFREKSEKEEKLCP